MLFFWVRGHMGEAYITDALHLCSQAFFPAIFFSAKWSFRQGSELIGFIPSIVWLAWQQGSHIGWRDCKIGFVGGLNFGCGVLLASVL